MKNTLGILLLIAYAAAIVKPITPFVEYSLNKDFIAKELCENKAKPEMKCNGRCYLTKKVKEQSDQKKEKTTETRNLNIHIINPSFFKAVYVELSNQDEFVIYSMNFSFGIHKAIFHPPQRAVLFV